MNKRRTIGFAALAAAIFLAGVVTSRFIVKYRDAARPDTKSTSQASAGDPTDAPDSIGRAELKITGRSQRLSGITTIVLEPIMGRGVVTAYGQVLDPSGLIELRDDYTAAEASVKKAAAQILVSRNEYERTTALYHFNRNVSIEQLQNAEAAYDSDVADSIAAVQHLTGVVGEIRSQWGNVMADWIGDHSKNINDLIENRLSILMVTVPPGTDLRRAPAEAEVSTADGNITAARFISISPRTDPSIQGLTFLYSVPSSPSLSSGTSVIIHFRLGMNTRGVVVPDSAVVWWNGSAWVYLAAGDEEFRRVMVSLTNHAAGGWFITGALQPGDRIVISGAQLLLSNEITPHVEGQSGGDDD